MGIDFLQHQVDALQIELRELVELSDHTTDILDTFLEKSKELDSEDRNYVSFVNQELKEKINKLKFLRTHGK
tara:strand:+ start:362 stop:577 length:216 start_codon:yes stop_codon:yes gene_type:complete